MVDFDAVMAYIFRYEGGLTSDTGGLTKYGISQHAFPSVDIRNLTKDAAETLYHKYYWEPINGDSLPASLRLAAMDCAINEGVGVCEDFLAKSDDDLDTFIELRKEHYRSLARQPKYKRYLTGWLNRLDRVANDTQSLLDTTGDPLPPTSSVDPVPMSNDAAPGPQQTDYVQKAEDLVDTLPKSLWKSKIAWASGGLGSLSIANSATSSPTLLANLETLFSEPVTWFILITIGMVVYILYARWRDHGRGTL